MAPDRKPSRPQSLAALTWFIVFACGLTMGDLSTGDSVATLARSPMVFLAPLTWAALAADGAKLSRVGRFFGLYWALTVVTGGAMLGLHLFTGGAATAFGKNLLVRLFQTSGENFTHFMAIACLAEIHKRAGTLCLLRWLDGTYHAMAAAGLLEFAAPKALALFHSQAGSYTANPDGRLYLLTSEPSQAFPLFTVLFIFTLILALETRNRPRALVSSILFIIVSNGILSKGGWPLVLLAALVAGSSRPQFRRILLRTLPVAAVLVTALYFLVLEKIFVLLVRDMAVATSFSTRVSGLLTGLTTPFYFPLGMGYGTYLVHLPKRLLATGDFLTSWTGIPFNLSEITLAATTGETLGGKCGLANQLIQNGLTAVIFLGFATQKAWRASIDFASPGSVLLLRIGIAFVALTLTFAADSQTLYAAHLPLVLAWQGWIGRRPRPAVAIRP